MFAKLPFRIAVNEKILSLIMKIEPRKRKKMIWIPALAFGVVCLLLASLFLARFDSVRKI